MIHVNQIHAVFTLNVWLILKCQQIIAVLVKLDLKAMVSIAMVRFGLELAFLNVKKCTLFSITSFFIDIDECETGESNCDPNAACYNYVGHHECSCRAPYMGNGIECTYEMNCNSCDPNADCVEIESQKKCICKIGYIGDGFICRKDTCNSEILAYLYFQIYIFSNS